jgi:hypothetical protein
MKKKENFKKNFNGEDIKQGEVMIPFEYTELDDENCTNRECIKTVSVGGKNFKVIYKAVPEAWAKIGTSALTLVQNEELGHYSVPNSVSMNAMEDEYGLEMGTSRSVEDEYMERVEIDEALTTFVELVKSLIDKSPKIGYAVLLLHTGIKGQEFYSKMRLSMNPANRVRQEAERILHDGLDNVDVDGIKCYKNQHTDTYRKEALQLLDKIVKMYR